MHFNLVLTRRFTKSIIYLHVVTKRLVYNSQTNGEFRYRGNDHKDNNRKSLRVEYHKQVGFFAHFQTAGHSGFINDTQIRFIDKTNPSDPTRRVRIFG